MKLYKYNAMLVSGNADPYTIFNNLKKEYQNIEYFNLFNSDFYGRKDNPFKHPLDGIRINKIFSGNTTADLDGKECHIQLDTNIELFSERCVLLLEFEFTIDDKDSFEKFYNNLNKKFMNEKVFNWNQDKGKVECSIYSIFNDFLFKKLFPIASDKNLQKVYDDFDPTKKSAIVDWKDKINQVTGIDPDMCGERLIRNIQPDVENKIIIDNCNYFDINNDCTKYTDKYPIYISNKTGDYICTNKFEINNFIRDFKNNLLFLYIIDGHSLSLEMWSDTINKESNELITNLESKNEVFWEEFRLKIEEWQLHFVSQNVMRSRSLSALYSTHLLKFNSLDKQTRNQWQDYVSEKQKVMEKFINEIKYSLNIISTPGDVHGEQELQKTSETTNERILFLSFLAMSVPMLGAILSPDITTKIKLISASILLFLPIIYFITIKISKRRLRKTDKIRNYKMKKEHLEQYIAHYKKEIEETGMNEKLDKRVKKEIIGFSQNILKFSEKHLEKINSKIG